MNRFNLGLLDETECPQSDQCISSQENELAVQDFASSTTLAFEHSVFLPSHFESRYQYPVLIWLHPAGADEHQLVDVLPAVSERNFIGASLRGSGISDDGFHWPQTSDAIETVSNQVTELMEWIEWRFQINRDRVFVAGAGCGGTMAFRLAFRQPGLFSGAGSFNGCLPDSQNPLDNLCQCRNVPVFWVHTRESECLPESRLCCQLKLLHIAGFDVTLRQYPGGDELSGQLFSDFNTWMMEQIAAQSGSGIVL